MGIYTHKVTVILPVREDDVPLDDVEVVERVRKVVEAAVNDLYDDDPDFQESLGSYGFDIDCSVSRAWETCGDNDDQICSECSEEIVGSHYHCANCGKLSSMMGHYVNGEFRCGKTAS